MVLVTEADCQAGRVEPCPPTCSHLSLTNNCTAGCILGRMHSVFVLDYVCADEHLYACIALEWKLNGLLP